MKIINLPKLAVSTKGAFSDGPQFRSIFRLISRRDKEICRKIYILYQDEHRILPRRSSILSKSIIEQVHAEISF